MPAARGRRVGRSGGSAPVAADDRVLMAGQVVQPEQESRACSCVQSSSLAWSGSSSGAAQRSRAGSRRRQRRAWLGHSAAIASTIGTSVCERSTRSAGSDAAAGRARCRSGIGGS